MNIGDTAYYVIGGVLSSLALAAIVGRLLRRRARPRARGGEIPAMRPVGADLPGSLRTRIRLARAILHGDAVAYRLRLTEMPGSAGGGRFWMQNCTTISTDAPHARRAVFHPGPPYVTWEPAEPTIPLRVLADLATLAGEWDLYPNHPGLPCAPMDAHDCAAQLRQALETAATGGRT